MEEQNDRTYLIFRVDSSMCIEEGKRSELQDRTKSRNIWYNSSALGECFFKEKNPMPGLPYDNPPADWSEKVAYEVAKLLDLPIARYELATAIFNETNERIDGVISVNYFPDKSKVAFSNTGGELLEMVNRFDKSNSKIYTIENTLAALDFAGSSLLSMLS